MKSIESLSIVVQWDVVDDFLPTTYAATWGDRIDQFDTVDEQTSYTITGLTLDTVYTITVSAANRCGSRPEFRTSVPFSTDTTSTTSSISPTVTASTNPVTIISTENPSSSTTTTTTALSITTANSMTTTVSRDTGYTTKTISSLTAITTSSNAGASIADTTTATTTTTITSVTITIATTTTVITNTCLNIGMYFQNTYLTIASLKLFCKISLHS